MNLYMTINSLCSVLIQNSIYTEICECVHDIHVCIFSILLLHLRNCIIAFASSVNKKIKTYTGYTLFYN